MKRICSLLLALVVLLTGCSAKTADKSQKLADNREPEVSQPIQEMLYPGEGGELRLAIQNPKSLLPWKVTDEATGKLLMLMYNPLVNVNEEGELVPCLAESWSWSEDLTRMTFKLRDDVTFHNGEPLTASDVVYTINKLKSSANVFQTAVSRIAQVDIVDNRNVQLTFSAEMNEENLVFPIVLYEYDTDLRPMGTGPYAYAASEAMREMRLKRFDGYFGEKPYILDVTVYWVRQPEAVEQAFDTTRTNMMQTDSFSWGNYVNQRDLTIHRYESSEALYLEFNQSGGFGASLSNRQKTAYAIDAAEVLRNAYWGKGNVTETLLRPASWYQGHTTKEYGYDAEKALSMETVGSSQITLLYDAQDFVQVNAADTLCEQLTAAGFSVRLTTSGAYDIALRREKMTLMKAAQKLGQAELLQNAATDEQVQDAAAQLDEKMVETLPVYTLFFLSQGTVTGYGIKGELTPNDGNVFLGIEDLYMKGSTGE